MSPRSEEFMVRAKENLGAARAVLDREFPGQAISLAYYAMLYAARAALSEHDRYAKTHSGTWNLFQELFVESGEFGRDLLSEARRAQEEREGSDYEARQFTREDGARVTDLADRFVAAVEQMLAEDATTA